MNAKYKTRAFCRITLFLAALSVSADAAWPQAQTNGYKFQTLDFPGASATAANGINNSGQVVGSYQIGSTIHGFLRSQGQFTTIDNPNASGTGTFASGISNSGAIAGTYTNGGDAHDHGYLLSGGQLTDFLFPTTPGHQQNTFAAGVTTNGGVVVVGYYQSLFFTQCGGGLTQSHLHGWAWSGGNFTQLDYPSACDTQVFGINDAGQMVGFADGHGYLLSNGFSSIMVQGSTSTRAFGINNFGDIVGDWTDVNGNRHGFIRKNGNFTTFDFPNATSTTAYGINDDGDIVGSYVDTNGQTHGFITDPVALVDPVPDLLSGPAVISVAAGAQLLATKGTKVQGVGADGVTQVVIRIQADRAGDQFILTLINDQNGPINPDEDGALGSPGDTTFTQNHMTATAVDTGSGPNGPNPPFAFAIYRAPKDFARPTSATTWKSGTCAGISASDNQLKCRAVTLQVQTPLGNIITTPVTIVRAPVILIHGLWSNWAAWNNFDPLVTGPGTVDPRFSVGRVSYDSIVPGIFGTDPFYSVDLRDRIRANSMGLAYNAPFLLEQVNQWISLTKTNNPAGVPVAAVQADIVGHSMGGLMARALVLQTAFLSDNTFAQGTIHKLVTVDTPHLGAQLAIQLLAPAETNGCLQHLLASRDNFAINVAFLNDGTNPTGAMADLQGDDTNGTLSNTLAGLNSATFHPVPSSLIAGIYQNFSALDSSASAFAIRHWGLGCPNDPLAQQLTSTGWPGIFHNNPNDAIVSENSQLAGGTIPSPGSQFFGYVHSADIEKLGFSGPSVLDPDVVPPRTISVPNQVIFLLNRPFTETVYYNPLNP